MVGITDEEIKELRDGLSGVTPGPWEAVADECAECRKHDRCEANIYGLPGGKHGQFDNLLDAKHVARCSPDKIASFIARLEAAEGGWQPKVKPLEWREEEPGWFAAEALTFRAGYEVWRTAHESVRWRVPGDTKFRPFAGTLDEAKAAAQSDYETRILSVLLPAPPAKTEG